MSKKNHSNLSCSLVKTLKSLQFTNCKYDYNKIDQFVVFLLSNICVSKEILFYLTDCNPSKSITMKLFIVASLLVAACVSAQDVAYEADNYVYDTVNRDGGHGGSYGAPEPVYGAPSQSYGAPSYGGGHGRGGDVDPHTSVRIS